MNNTYLLSKKFFFSVMLLLPVQSCPADTGAKTENKSVWSIPTLVALGTTTLVVAKSIYNNIGPKYGGRVRNNKDIQYLQTQAAEVVRKQARKKIAGELQALNVQNWRSVIYRYNRKQDDTVFKMCERDKVFDEFIDPLALYGRLLPEDDSGCGSEEVDATRWINTLLTQYVMAQRQVQDNTRTASGRFIVEQYSWKDCPWQRIKAWASLE